MERIEISRKKFTENLESCFNLIENGTQIILKWGKNRVFMTPAVDDDPDCFTPHMIERIKHSEQQASEGKVKTIGSRDELKSLLGL
jgi:hypothetical protein